MKNAQEPSTEERLSRINRTLPYSDEAEKGVLGCILQNPEGLLPECSAKLPVDVFYHFANRIVYEEMVTFMTRDIPLDIVTLTQALRQKNLLDKVGGPGALSELFTYIPATSHFQFYKKQITDKWLLRRLITACAEGIELAFVHGNENIDEDALQALTRAEEKVFAVLQMSLEVSEAGLGPIKAADFMHGYVDHLEKIMANKGKVTGVLTGLHDLDRVICGLDQNRGELMCIGARPGHGKSAFLGTLMLHMCIEMGLPTLAFSLEMGTYQIIDRVAFGGAGVDTNKSRTGMVSRAEEQELGTSIMKIQGSPLWIDESGELNTVEFRARVDMMVRQHGIKVLIIDYLQLLEPCTKIGKNEERLAIAEALKIIHALKKKHKLIILCAAQLNQNIEKTPGRRHMLSDYAGSDTIGKYADYALFIVRPAEIKRWKDLDDKRKQRTIENWHEARYACPEMYCGRRIKEASAHPSEGLPFDSWENNEQKRPRKPPVKMDEANEDGRDLNTTLMRVKDGTEWLFDNEKEWDQSAELQFVKNRNGPTPDIPVRYRRELTMFESRTPKLFSNNKGERQQPTSTAA